MAFLDGVVIPGTPEADEFLASFPTIVDNRFNPNHSKTDGKFASKSGGGGHAAPSSEEAKVAIKGGKEITRGSDRAVYHRDGDYFAFKRATSTRGIASNDREMEAYAEVKELGTGHEKVKVPEMVRVDERIIATQFIEGTPLSTLPTPKYNKLDSDAIRAAKSLTNGDWHDDQVILDDKGNLWVVDLSGLGPEGRALSVVTRTVHYGTDSCLLCRNNTDPKAVPLHPHCTCNITTEDVQVGQLPRDHRNFQVISMADEDVVYLSESDLPVSITLDPATTGAIEVEDLRFGDLARWLEQMEPYLGNADLMLTVMSELDTREDQLDQVSEVASEIAEEAESIAESIQLVHKRVWFGLSKVVGL